MKKRHRAFVFISLATSIFLLMFFVEQPTKEPSKSDKLQIVASFYPIYFFASEIGGEHVEVINITPSGIEPHDYEPTPRDIVNISRSKIVLLNGAGFETWDEYVQKNVDPSKTTIVELGDTLATQTLLEENITLRDPHIWLSPVLATQIVQNILRALLASDPTRSEYYTNNARQLMDKLTTLDTDYRTGFTNCTKKDFVTSHAAFGYLAEAYGLTQTSITGLSPESEPSGRELGNLVQFIRERNIQVIFFESLASPKLSQILAKETGAMTMVLDPIEGLSEEDVRVGNNYFTIMRRNLEHLRIALECQK